MSLAAAIFCVRALGRRAEKPESFAGPVRALLLEGNGRVPVNSSEHDTSLPVVLVSVGVAVDDEFARRRIDFMKSCAVEKGARWAWEAATLDRLKACAAQAIAMGAVEAHKRDGDCHRALSRDEMGPLLRWCEGERKERDPSRRSGYRNINEEWFGWLIPAPVDWNTLETGSTTKREPSIDSVPSALRRESYLKMVAVLGDEAGLFSKEKRKQAGAVLSWLALLGIDLNESSVRSVLDEARAAGFIKEPAKSGR